MNNQIISCNYMGVVFLRVKVRTEGHQGMKECRQFLITRLRSLELMFTNGISFWVRKIEGSQIDEPYQITETFMNSDCSSVILYCSNPLDQSKFFIKYFTFCKESMTFKLAKSSHLESNERQ